MREIVYKVEDEGAEAKFYAMCRDTGESSWLDTRAKEPVLSAAAPLLLAGGPRAFPIHVARILDPPTDVVEPTVDRRLRLGLGV
jgi:hypothetical protein